MGVGTALGIGMGIKAVTDIVGAKKAATASNKAAEQQQRAAQDAQRQMQQTWAPYMAHGGAALSALSQLTTPGPGAQFAAPDRTGLNPAGVPQGMPGTFGSMGPLPAGSRPMPQGGVSQGQAIPQGPQGHPMQPPWQQGGMPGTFGAVGQGGPTRAASPTMVQVQAPDGSIEYMPAQLAEQFVQRGAQIVR